MTRRIAHRRCTGPVCLSVGVLLLTVQAYAYWDVGLISAELIGGGIGLLLLGIMALSYRFDDAQSRRELAMKDELPTADEYERQFRDERMDGNA